MGERIRVLRLIARLNVGGPAIHVVTLTAGLDPARYESRLVCGLPGPHEGDMSYLLEAAGVQPVILPEMGRDVAPLADTATLARLVRLMRQFRPHVVHTHTAKAGAVGRLAARLAGVPVVVHTFHGHVFSAYFGAFQSRMAARTERALALMSDRLITLSERLRREIASYGVAPLEKIEVVPLGLDLARFAPPGGVPRGRLRESLGLAADDPLIGSVGRLVPVKDHDLFLRAAQVLRRGGSQARFVIVGDGELRGRLEAQARELGLGDVVFFTGWRRDLPEVYADLDLLVNTSRNEGTPVAVIEAMAAGVPVIATAVGGVPDVVADGVTGTLVPGGDVEALARALAERLAQPAETRRMADAAQAEALERFSVRQLLCNLDELYRRLLAAKGIT
jgi:glycosyltransferase involved in cell wall biosynthesis